MLFARVVGTSERVTATSKRLEKIELLATLLKQATKVTVREGETTRVDLKVLKAPVQ